MKYCYHCGRVTGGEPLFCQSCGRSFDVKFCPRLHPNPRYATVCSQCGTRELSTPQPKVSIWWKALAFLVRIVLGIALVYASLSVLVLFLSSPKGQSVVLIFGFVLLVFWAMWLMLPEWLRKLIHRLLRRKERHHER